MTLNSNYQSALIVGAGDGLSASLARKLAHSGVKVGLVARNIAKLDALCEETSARAFAADVTNEDEVTQAFSAAAALIGGPDIVVYNPSARLRGSIAELNPAEVQRVIAVTAFGGFLVAQQAARRMLVQGRGAILFTGASASVKGYPLSAPSAMGKFALRGLAESMARELGPLGIHVAHVLIDGAIRSARNVEAPDKPDSLLDPDAIAEGYLQLLRQPRSAWTFELDLRPWVEKF